MLNAGLPHIDSNTGTISWTKHQTNSQMPSTIAAHIAKASQGGNLIHSSTFKSLGIGGGMMQNNQHMNTFDVIKHMKDNRVSADNRNPH
jgi:hypothetical protein